MDAEKAENLESRVTALERRFASLEKVVTRQDVLEFRDCARELKWHLRWVNSKTTLDTRVEYQKLRSAGVSQGHARRMVKVLAETARSRHFDSLLLYDELVSERLHVRAAEALCEVVMAALNPDPDDPFDESKAVSRLLEKEELQLSPGAPVRRVNPAQVLSQEHKEASVEGDPQKIACAVVEFIMGVARVYKGDQ